MLLADVKVARGVRHQLTLLLLRWPLYVLQGAQSLGSRGPGRVALTTTILKTASWLMMMRCQVCQRVGLC